MKITTTFGSQQIHCFDQLLYINGKTKDIMFQANLDNPFETYLFFKDIARFSLSETVRKTLYSSYNDDYYQFAVLEDGQVTPIKWFDLIINDKTTVSHDIAFNTTLIRKNDIDIPFGKFPMWCKKPNSLPLYREFKIKNKAYRYMANQINKTLL